jgi:probable DNA metabolism protein
MGLEDKLSILADAAKYDVSCASSGSRRANRGGRLGNAAPCGICHTFTEDGRCVSLLKILFTNACIFDCAYCVHRAGNDVRRASFSINEIVTLTLDFYRRNYIEGLFLSSGILRSPDETMERLVRAVRVLREQGFNGYIHLKCVPFASPPLIRQAGRYADRLSVNIELPSEASLKRLTRDKTYNSVLAPMSVIREGIAETREDRRRLRHVPAFAPAGQSTQLIVGASPESDYEILTLANGLYRQQALKRVYYSAYIPVAAAGSRLASISEPPLTRENRLYQADWLLRLYGFSIGEVISAEHPHLDLEMDPKQAFARRHPERFPVDINAADREMILKVPGIGLKSADRIVNLRRSGRIRFEHLKQMGVVVSRARKFILCDGAPSGQWAVASTERTANVPRNTERRGVEGASPARASRLVFETDGTFEGLLTALYESYAQERLPDALAPGGSDQRELFERRIKIMTDPGKSDRVWKGLKEHLGPKDRRKLYEAHLSGHPGVETAIHRYVRDKIPGKSGRATEPHLASHIEVDQLARKVRGEAHRLKGFIRFQQTGEDRYLALIEPRYDVLPLLRRHFESRFADQHWIIYDTKRNYGLCHEGGNTRELRWGTDEVRALRQCAVDAERLCQALWKLYYDAVNIPQRNNPKLHLRQLPRRYWRYLPEKNESA